MYIRPVSFGSYKSQKPYQQPQANNNQHVSSGITKAIPLAVAIAVLPMVNTSCIMDTRNAQSADWFAVGIGRLSDEQVAEINRTRQAPKNTVFQKVNETETVYYTDSDGEEYSEEVETGEWHYELVNNALGGTTGTTVLPEGFTVVKDFLGFIEIVEDGTTGIFLKNKDTNISKIDTVENKISFLEAGLGVLTDEQIEKINKTGVVPEGTIIVKTEYGYDIENNRLGLTTGTRRMPAGYEMRRDLLGFVEIVPVDKKSIFLRPKKSGDAVKTENTESIDILQAGTRFLTDKQVEMINKTRRMPEGTIIIQDELGDYYISYDITNLSSGTRTLPKGFEVKKNRIGVAEVVPIGQQGIITGEPSKNSYGDK